MRHSLLNNAVSILLIFLVALRPSDKASVTFGQEEEQFARALTDLLLKSQELREEKNPSLALQAQKTKGRLSKQFNPLKNETNKPK